MLQNIAYIMLMLNDYFIILKASVFEQTESSNYNVGHLSLAKR